MKTEDNALQTGFSNQFHCQDGILLAPEVFQTRILPSMPRRIQPAGISVSIVENDPHSSQLLSDLIRRTNGFSFVNSHSSVESALASLPVEKPSIVLISSDLPGHGAITLIRQLKPLLQQTQIIMLTGDEDSERIFDALVVGATGYLRAQTSRAELLAALKLIHAGGSPISSPIAKKVLQSFQNQSRLTAAELSPRENRLLRLLAGGSSCDEAAQLLNISLPMVSTYIRSTYEKLQVQSVSKNLR